MILCASMCVCVCIYVCVVCVVVCLWVCGGVFVKLYMTAQSGPVILLIL